MIVIKTKMQNMPESCSQCDYCMQEPDKYYGALACIAVREQLGMGKIINIEIHREKPEWCPLKNEKDLIGENDTAAVRHYCEECFYAEWFDGDFYNCKFRANQERGTSLVNEDDCCVYFASKKRINDMWEYCVAHWHPAVVAYNSIGKTSADLGPYTIECYYNETLKMENIQAEEEK